MPITGDGNWFAYIALLSWPVVALYLYSRQPAGRATLWTILGGYLLLPKGCAINFSGIPPLDKVSLSNLAALIGCLLVTRFSPRIWNRFGLPEVLILLALASAFLTAEYNSDTIVIGSTVLPGLGYHEAFSVVVGEIIILIPFFLGRRFLGSSTDTEEIIRVLVIAGLLYSLPMLFEIRMSPQFNRWIYGYYPSSWVETLRDGGFRPVVFIGHGLPLAFFTSTTVVASAALWRARTRIYKLPRGVVVAYLGGLLILCKSLASIVYGTVLAPLVLWTTPRLQLRIALVLVSFMLLYPMLRMADYVPVDSIIDAAKTVSSERADSLEFRFVQEKALLEHASTRILFGWGRFGRSLIYDERTGGRTSITDGGWIRTVGHFGLIGFFARFGLLALPIVRLASAFKFSDSSRERIYLAALVLILAISIFNLIPNGNLTPLTWLYAGAILGRAEALSVAARAKPKFALQT